MRAVAMAPMPRVAMEIGSAAEIAEFRASTDFTTVITIPKCLILMFQGK